MSNPGFQSALPSSVGANKCIGAERMLTDWLLWHRLPFAVLAGPKGDIGAEAGGKKLDVTYALASGNVSERSKWHAPAYSGVVRVPNATTDGELTEAQRMSPLVSARCLELLAQRDGKSAP